MRIVEFKVGEKRTRGSGVSLELIGADGKRAGLMYVDRPDMAPRLIAAERVEIGAGPR